MVVVMKPNKKKAQSAFPVTKKIRPHVGVSVRDMKNHNKKKRKKRKEKEENSTFVSSWNMLFCCCLFLLSTIFIEYQSSIYSGETNTGEAEEKSAHGCYAQLGFCCVRDSFALV